MAGIYRQRHPEHTVFYRVFFHYFEQFLQEYEDRFKRGYGFFRPVIKDVVEKYLDCGNPMCGFAPRSDVPIVEKNSCLCFPVRLAGSVHHVMPNAERNGASGCGESFSWMFPIVRSSSPFPRCCVFSSVTSGSSLIHYASLQCGHW
jgi:hypothetical protein